MLGWAATAAGAEKGDRHVVVAHRGASAVLGELSYKRTPQEHLPQWPPDRAVIAAPDRLAARRHCRVRMRQAHAWFDFDCCPSRFKVQRACNRLRLRVLPVYPNFLLDDADVVLLLSTLATVRVVVAANDHADYLLVDALAVDASDWAYCSQRIRTHA